MTTEELEKIEVTEPQQMGCYRCGGPSGSMFTLCPGCIASDNAKRQNFKQSLYVDTNVGETPLIFRIHYYPKIQIALVALVFASVLAFYLSFPDFSRETTASVVLRAILTVSGWLLVLTWTYFWITLLIVEPIWALASILLPFLVYKFIILKWDEVRYIFIWHCVALCFWVAAYVGYEQMYAKYLPPGQETPWAPFDRPTNPKFGMPELPDDTTME